MSKQQTTRRLRHVARRRYPLGRLIRANLYDLGLLLNESWVVLAGFFAVTLIGTLYLSLAYSLQWLEALYETLKLQTLQSDLAFPQDILGRLLFFLIPLLGLALIFQGVLNFGRLLLDKGSRREAWQIALASTYRDHVIVCGLGRVGLRTVNQLIEAGYQPVVIERDWNSEYVERVINRRVPVVVGDAREPLSLRRAGLMRARAVVAAINDDLLNVEIALTARKLHPQIRLVLRVFNDELDRNLERSLGRNSAFSASALAASTYAAATVSREIDYVLHGAGGMLGITQLTVQPDTKISGFTRAIEEAQGIRVLIHEAQDGRPIPRNLMSQISPGDTITLIGTLAALEASRLLNVEGSKLDFLQALPLQHPTEQFDTVIVCGLGKVGYRVVRQLYRLTPRPRIVVIRLSEGRAEFHERIDQLDGVTTIIGDAREISVLRRAGLDKAFSVAALTSNDLLNVQISLAARRARPDTHIVLRVFSDTLADKLTELFGIRTAYSTSGLASPTLAAAALIGNVTQGFSAAGTLFSTEQVHISSESKLVGQTVEQLYATFGALVIELRHAHHTIQLPPFTTTLAAGDDLTILAPIQVITAMRTALA